MIVYYRHKSIWNEKIIRHINKNKIKCEVAISRASQGCQVGLFPAKNLKFGLFESGWPSKCQSWPI